MKANFLLTTVLFVLFSMIAGNIHAQQKLDELTKRLETMDNVDINVVQRRNPETKKMERTIKNYTVTGKGLVDQILAAFEQDKQDAIRMIENKQAGRLVPSMYTFESNGRSVSYTFALNDDGNGATLTLMERNE